jgi:hypothetical protein
MLIAVTRGGKGVFHFAGELDEYNLTVVGDHVRGLTRSNATAELRIRLDADEESAFRNRATQWIGRLADAGVAVTIHAPGKATGQAPARVPARAS